MFTKSLIAAAAIASVVSFASAPAQAETNVDFNFGIGLGDFGPGYGGGGYGGGYGFDDDFPGYGFHGHHPRPRPMYHGVSCGGGRDIVRSAGFRHVTAFDCSAPTYGYKAWRDCDLYKVKVSYNGRIISVRPIW